MSSESLKSLIVTDPSLLDEGIDVSGLRTETDTNPRLLASIADFPGISYDPTSFDYLSDLNELFAYGLPGGDTSGAVTPPVTTTPDTGGGGQETSPSITDTIPELSSGAVNTAEEQRLIDAGIGVQGAPGDPVVAPGEIPVTQAEMDEFNRIPVTPVSPTTQPIDPTGMLPQTSTPYMVEGALGVDPREKMDFVTAEDAADPTFLDRIGLGQFNPVEAFVKAAINKSIGLPVTFLIDTLVNTLPPQDPRQIALNEFYDVKDGTIQSGLMTGYNPVSGNPLDPTYGLQEAYQKRLDTINKTLGAMTLEEYQNTDLVQRKKDIEEAMAKEKARLDLFSGDVDERDQMLEDISLQNKIDAGIRAAEDDKGSEMLDTTQNIVDEVALTGVNPFADIDTGVGEFDNTKKPEEFIPTYFPEKDVYNQQETTRQKKPVDDKRNTLTFLEQKESPEELAERIDAELIARANEIDRIKREQDIARVTKSRKVQEELAEIDQATVREVASISDRQPEVIEQKKNELANIYDRQVERGEREADTTITSDINKAKATIDMPQMLGDVGGSMDRRDEAKTTPSRSLSTTKPGTSGPPESVRRGGGEGSSGGGGGKIVCTMMNDSYGFGSFRNKIWLRHSKGLAPEYQKGYHKIFLPLVKIAKTNKIVKKVLEHIAVHRTIDIRQESRGKVHLLGRVYRKILEPICYIVGKYAKR